MQQILIDLDKCLGCRSCELSCAVAHSASRNLFDALAEAVPPRARVAVERSGETNFPIQCRHCSDPQCVKACMTGALTQDPRQGLVVQDTLKCVGCWMCVMVCPFGAIVQDNSRRVALKCDRCPNRTEPACVEACPTKAITCQEVEEYSKEKRQAFLQRFTCEEVPA
ncbi:MAG: 4Fe-4S dicluster domain-containing protein [Bacillota bacterium]